MDFDENAVILAKEPLDGVSPTDIREWLLNNDTDADLARAMAVVHNKAGWLHHELGELEGPELSQAIEVYREWYDVEKELYKRIFTILTGKNPSEMPKTGLYYMVKPFMERNGYNDGAGWW